MEIEWEEALMTVMGNIKWQSAVCFQLDVPFILSLCFPALPHRKPTFAGVESSWNVMTHGDAREGKWRGNWRMEWVASTLHTTSEHGVSGITTANAHTSAASSRLNWRPRRFKWNRRLRRKTKSGFCPCAITFQTQSTSRVLQYSRIQSKRRTCISCSLLTRHGAS